MANSEAGGGAQSTEGGIKAQWAYVVRSYRNSANAAKDAEAPASAVVTIRENDE